MNQGRGSRGRGWGEQEVEVDGGTRREGARDKCRNGRGGQSRTDKMTTRVERIQRKRMREEKEKDIS